ncbi:hypothetical protein B0H10DRAFT_2245563 [Mycena sp. CBHHK59/15]|nr:hypothetical protein B0H10DRAFT_2245563 [Mycena sp. CBHHK59/15]
MATLVVDDEKPFIADDWIGKGKSYSGDLPGAVLQAKITAFTPPEPVVGLVPAGNVPVMEFAAIALPHQSSELAYGESQLCIPPQAVLDLLGRKAGQAWLNGVKSVIDPRYNEGADRLPLWVLTYWMEMAGTIEHQTNWKRSIGWLENEHKKCKEEHTRAAIEEARAALKTLGWNAPLRFGKQKTSTTYLNQFLGTVWLSTDSIDIMMEELAARVEGDPDLADVTEREVKEEEKKKIVFPVNVGDSHWVAGVVDFTKKTIEFGDSLPGFFEPPQKFIKAAKRWLQLQFGTAFHSEYDALEHGVQKDGYSCGIVMFNTCERALYPDTPVWIPRSAVLAWIQHFLKYAKNQIIEKSTEAHLTGAARARISIADLLNPRNGQSNISSDSIVSSYKSEAGSSNYSDADVLLGRATWDDDSEDDESMVGAPPVDMSDHLSFATSSGADFGDWDATSRSSAMDVDVGPLGEDEAAENATWEGEEQPAVEVDAADVVGPSTDESKSTAAPGGKSEPKKSKIQSTLFGFFTGKGKGKGRSEDFQPKEPAQSGGKRCRAGTDASGSSAASSVPTKKPKKVPAPKASSSNVGLSKAATWARQANGQVRNGTFVVDPGKYVDWKHKILAKDPQAEFFEGASNIKDVRHSKCATVVKVKTPYDSTRFIAHVERECPVMHCGAGMSTLPSFDSFKPGGSKAGHAASSRDTQAPPWDVPCPGVTDDDIPNVQRYIHRTGAMGGGSRSVFKIAMQTFKKSFSALAGKHQQENALRKAPRDPKNYIYTNKQYRNQVLDEIYGRTIGLQDIIEQPNAKTMPYVRYAQGALQGKYDNKVFNGLVEAMVTKADKEERGVGMQNFKWAPAYNKFCNIVRITSPAAYRAFQEHLPGRTERSFRAKEAHEPQFPMDISDRNFQLAADHLATLKYEGPVSLSCDDTKLFPSFRLLWQGEEITLPCSYCGSAKKATKIRLWCLTIPVPGVAPIIVAALPIPNDLRAEVLLTYLDKVVNGLIDQNINIISYACDGTQIERTVQEMFVKQASEKREHLINDPRGKGPPLRITIAVVRGHKICMIQDAKHTLKTFRNNLFSGARLLALGSYTAIYSRIWEMAFADGSPLFHRDIEKLDRQDDNAATRLFSADTLQYLADHHPEYLGEIIYLFIFGELIDAYQNRSMCHADRLQLVLRARYFLDSWNSFLDIAGYNKSAYFLSREAVDITRIIIEGYIALLYIHRDYLTGLYPLLPWLHSSEACEHVFGESRRIVKDFSMLDFLYMIPKLRVKIRAAVLRGKTSNPKDRAAGYSHTYFDSTGLNILALSTFPSDTDIELIASAAAEESDSLIAMLGLTPVQLHFPNMPTTPMLPGIDTWYDSDADDSDDDTDSISEAQQLQDLIDKAEDATIPRTCSETKELLSITSAALVLAADDMAKTHSAQEIPNEVLDELIAEEQRNMGIVESALSEVAALSVSEASKPLGRGSATAETITFDHLVELRHRHQTIQAACGVRTRVVDTTTEKAKAALLKQQLIRKFHLALKEEQDQAAGTGLNRTVCWQNSAPGGRAGKRHGVQAESQSAGNSENTAATATAVARTAAKKRKDIFTKARVPNLSDIISGLVTLFRPIHIGDYGVIFTPRGLMIGHVFAMHSKGGGKYGKHEAVTDSSNISALSKISVQIFENFHGAQFRSIPTSTAILQSKQFAHIAPIDFLCLLSSVPKLVPTGLELTPEDSEHFKKLSAGFPTFIEAMKLFRKQGKKITVEADDLDDGIEDEEE